MQTGELHVISDGRRTLAAFARIASAVLPYVDCFHLREPGRTAQELLAGLRELEAAGVPRERIIVNDRLDVAACAGVCGVQLAHHSLAPGDAKRLFPGMRIGASVHSPEEAAERAGQGADYLIYGHVYATESKPGLAPRGLTGLREATAATCVPVIAIGGMTPERVPEVKAAGAAGIAVMSGILAAADPVDAARRYRKALQSGGGLTWERDAMS